jgi:hypothetical protein
VLLPKSGCIELWVIRKIPIPPILKIGGVQVEKDNIVIGNTLAL